MEKSKPGFGSNNQPDTTPSPPRFADDTSHVKSNDTGVSQSAKSLGDDIKDAANTANRAVKEQASQFASDVGHELSQTAENQKMRGVKAIQCFARAISSAAAELDNQSPQIARSVRDAAAKVDLSEIKAAARFPGNPGLDPEGA